MTLGTAIKFPAWVFINNEKAIVVEAPTIKDAADCYLSKYSTHGKSLLIVPISDVYYEAMK